jgi:hypothetical protein
VSFRPSCAHRSIVLDNQTSGITINWINTSANSTTAARKLEARERIRGQRHQHQLRAKHHGDEQNRIQEIARERGRLPGLVKILEGKRRGGHEVGRIFRCMECRPHGVGERQDPEQPKRPCAGGFQGTRDRKVGMGTLGAAGRRAHW